MAFQPCTNTALVTMNWLHNGGATWSNALHFSKTGFDQDAMDDLGAAVNAGVQGASFLQHLSQDVSYRGCTVTDLRTEGAPSSPYAVIITGADNNDSDGFSLGVVVTLRTALRGRSYRGRFYLAGISDGYLVDNLWTEAVAGEAAALIGDIQTEASAVGWTLGVLSRFHNGVERTSGLCQPVTSFEVRSRIPGTQRRRNRRP